MLRKGGVPEEASRTRVRYARCKFNKFALISTKNGASLRLKKKVHRYCVQIAWCAVVNHVNDIQRLERA